MIFMYVYDESGLFKQIERKRSILENRIRVNKKRIEKLEIIILKLSDKIEISKEENKIVKKIKKYKKDVIVFT